MDEKAQPRAQSAGSSAIQRLLDRRSAAIARAGASASRNPGPENLHALRIEVRRLRAVLDALDGELNPRLAAELKFDLKNVTRETGRARDADARRAMLLPRVKDTLELPIDLKRHCAAAIESARVDERRALKDRMRESGWSTRLVRIRAIARNPELVAWMTASPRDVVDAAVSRVLRDLMRRVERRKLGPDRLHRVRRKIRAARYAVEALLPVVRLKPQPIASSLQKLQDALGLAHDLLQARRFLEESLLPAEARAVLAAAVDLEFERQLKRCRKKLKAQTEKRRQALEPWLGAESG